MSHLLYGAGALDRDDASVVNVVLQASSVDVEPARRASLMIRRVVDDQALLHARTKARGMPMAT